MSYLADLWEVFGINAIDVWDLPASHFFPMTIQIDRMRREAKTR